MYTIFVYVIRFLIIDEFYVQSMKPIYLLKSITSGTSTQTGRDPLVFGWNKTNRNSKEIHFAAEQKQREFFRLFSFKVKQQIKEAKRKETKWKK